VDDFTILFDLYFPLAFLFIPLRAHDPCVEMDILPKIELRGCVLDMFADLGATAVEL
jgi:hypothetical protein